MSNLKLTTMRNQKVFPALLVAFIFASITAFGSNNPDEKKDLKMPDNVLKIVENSCYGCHNTNSKNEDGKEALDFKKLATLSKIKKISAHKNIGDIVSEDKMPPKKFLNRFPEKALSEEDKKVLITWAKKEAEALVKGK